MFDSVITSVINWLGDADINAVRKFPAANINRSSAVVAVSVKSGVLTSSGAGNYLGIYEYGGTLKEVYGARAEISFALDIYTPAGTYTSVFDSIAGAVKNLPDGLKMRSLECVSPEFDKESGMFVLKCTMKCIAIMLRTETSEPGVFTDFVLRGELS